MHKTDENTLADVLFPDRTDEELSESILTIPPEQRRLHTETYDFAISTILDYIDKNNIFIPEFQRRYVWNNSQASRLIESLIIQCPIPVIYLSQGTDERLSVIDGNQRLLSIQKYVQNIFALKGLTAYPELEGLHFHELDPRFQRHINNRTLRCIVIAKDTHPQVKFDVFERLNSGSVKLSPQELRHGIYHGKFMELVKKLAKNKIWKGLLPAGVDRRMKGEELVIRFLALHTNLEEYKKPLSGFLNEFSESNRNLNEELAKEFTKLFSETVEGIKTIYGDLAFKIFDKDRKILSPFNAALFDAEMLSISKANNRIAKLTEVKIQTFVKALSSLFLEDDFLKSINRATSDENQIKYRIERVGDLLNKYL
jgi:hypothetical protein